MRPTRPLLWLTHGLLIGGALGNLIDRIASGSVTDFIELPLWPAFNVSDMAITFGVLARLVLLEGPGRDADRSAQAAPSVEARGRRSSSPSPGARHRPARDAEPASMAHPSGE